MGDVIGLHPDVTRPAGYAVFLKILEPLHSFAVVTILQHLMGLAVGVMVYALARHRFGVRPWIAALAAVPVLYDGFQIQLEHLIVSDVLFEFLLVLATTLLLWDAKPSWQRCTLIGLILGVSATVRSQGLPFLALFAVYIIIRRIGWRALAGTVVACLVPVLLYCSWFYAELRAVRDDRQHRHLPVLARHVLRRVLQDARARGRAVAVHDDPAGQAPDRRSPTSGRTSPRWTASRRRSSRRCPTSSPRTSPSARSRRSRWPTPRSWRTTRAASSNGGATPSRTRRPTTSTCSATTRSPSRRGPAPTSGRTTPMSPTTSAATR